MKNKRFLFFILGLALGIVSIWAMVLGQQKASVEPTADESVQVGNFETILIGKGGAPKWSPDGTEIAFIAEDGWLTIADAEGKGEYKKIVLVTFGGYDWLDSNTFLTYRRENTPEKGKDKKKIFILGTLTMDGKETLVASDTSLRGEAPNISGPFFLKDGTVGYYEGPFHSPGKDKVFKTLKTGRLKPEQAAKQEMKAFTKGDIWLSSLDGSIEKKITSGIHYQGAQLSPNGTKIMTTNTRGNILILDLDGNVLSSLGTGIYEGWVPEKGTGGDQKWSPNGKQLVYALTVYGGEDGQFIVASELYIVNWDGTGKIQITYSPDEIELNPSWSPDGTKIACVSDNTGNIFVIKLK